MKAICKQCKHYELVKEKWQCGRNYYEHESGYSPCYRGATCIHSETLEDRFEAKSKEDFTLEIESLKAQALIARQDLRFCQDKLFTTELYLKQVMKA